MFVYLNILIIYLLCIIRSSMCDICSTCLCITTDEGPIINCHGKDLGDNDMLNFDLLMLNKHETLNELILSKNNIIQLPGNLLKKLKHLKSLNLSGNLLKEIHIGEFADLNNLVNINFSKNQLQTFDDSFLKVLPMLMSLNLSYNNIESIEHTLEENMEKLNILDLSHNNISNLPNNFFETIQNLQYLDLSFNKIHVLHENSLIKLSFLNIFYINNNFLTSLRLQEFPDSLLELYSGYNSIKEIFYKSSQIQTLSIEYNHISHIESNITTLNHLQNLNISGNKLTDFPDIVLNELITLDISSNEYFTIPKTLSKQNFPMLRNLNVSSNPIEKLKMQTNLNLYSLTVNNLSTLQTIDEDAFLKLEVPLNDCINLTINNNEKLSFIHERTFQNLNICSLDLSNNHLSYISSKVITINDSFITDNINLQGNPFNCNCSIQWMLNDLLPKLYSKQPHLLENLRCAWPPKISNTRIVHWYGWKGQVFCSDMTDVVENLTMDVSDVSSSRIIIDSSPGLLAVLGTAITIFTILVIVGLLLSRKLNMKRSRMNRRF